jgi:hypothetical protein
VFLYVCPSVYVCLSVYMEQAHLVLRADCLGYTCRFGIAPSPVGAGEVKDGFAAKSDWFSLHRGHSP